MVFQSFNLFPHLSVLQNCMLAPMHVLGIGAKEAHDRAMHFLERVRIPSQAAKYPAHDPRLTSDVHGDDAERQPLRTHGRESQRRVLRPTGTHECRAGRYLYAFCVPSA